VTRFAGSLSSITNFLAGLVEVPFWTFFWCDLAGNVIEPFVALSLGYLVGDYWSSFSTFFSLLAATAAVSILLFISARMYRRMVRKYESPKES
jgi:membrane protein DedA with SNARE-associated domain